MSDIFEETGVKRYALRYRENSFSPWEYPSMRQQEGRDFRVQFSAPGATEAAQIIRAGYVLQVCGAAATAIISTQGRVTIRAGVLLPAQNDVALSVLIVLQSIFAYTGSILPVARRISARSPEKIRHPAGRVRQ